MTKKVLILINLAFAIMVIAGIVEMYRKEVRAVESSIDAIGTVRCAEYSRDRIKAARRNYERASWLQKKLVSNYKTLTDAEQEYDAVSGGNTNLVRYQLDGYYNVYSGELKTIDSLGRVDVWQDPLIGEFEKEAFIRTCYSDLSRDEYIHVCVYVQTNGTLSIEDDVPEIYWMPCEESVYYFGVQTFISEEGFVTFCMSRDYEYYHVYFEE